jgi:parvulin-like peptidyl-prolyl isomerase
LARKYTIRSGFKSNGGDLGWVSSNRYPDLVATAATLKPGEVGGPVPGVGQFSAIKLLETKPAVPRAFEDTKRTIFQKLQQQRGDSILQAYADSMKTAYPVVIHEDVLARDITAGSASGASKKG